MEGNTARALSRATGSKARTVAPRRTSSPATSMLLASRMSSVFGLKATPSRVMTFPSSGESALRMASTKCAARPRLISTTARSRAKS